MIIIRQLRLVCPHLVHNRLETRNIQSIDSPSNWEKFSYSRLYALESGFDLCGSLMIALKPHPDLLSSSTIRDSLKLRKRKTRKENTMSLAIWVVLVNLLLTDTSSKHLVVRILTNLPNTSINALKMRRHADLAVWVVCSIEVRRFAGTTLYITFVDHGPITVEWSLIGSDTNWRTENADQRRGEWEP